MSIDYSKCAICREKDHTTNMIMPCKCGTWVHRACLDKKRIKDRRYYDSCPICNVKYNLEVNKIPEWKKKAEIYLSVLRDLLFGILLFIIASNLLGRLCFRFNLTVTNINNQTLLGAAVICFVCGIIAFIFGIFYVADNQPIFLYQMNFNDQNAFVVFIIIGCIAVVSTVVYFTYKTLKERLEEHERSVGVKENIVQDYLRGVDNI